MRDARSEPGMTKQTTEHDETADHDETAEHDGPPVIAGCDRQSHKSNRHPDLSASHPRLVQQSYPTCTSVIHDLSISHPGPVQQSSPT